MSLIDHKFCLIVKPSWAIRSNLLGLTQCWKCWKFKLDVQVIWSFISVSFFQNKLSTWGSNCFSISDVENFVNPNNLRKSETKWAGVSNSEHSSGLFGFYNDLFHRKRRWCENFCRNWTICPTSNYASGNMAHVNM